MRHRTHLHQILIPKCSIEGCFGRSVGCIMCGHKALCLEHLERWQDCRACLFRMWEGRKIPHVGSKWDSQIRLILTPQPAFFVDLEFKPGLFLGLWLADHGFFQVSTTSGWRFAAVRPITPPRRESPLVTGEAWQRGQGG